MSPASGLTLWKPSDEDNVPHQSATFAPEATVVPRVWLPEIVENIARFVEPNEIACTLRLVDKATRAQFSKQNLVRLSLPVPNYVFKERWSRGAMRSLTLEQRQSMLHLTAASGVLENLEHALEVAGCAWRTGNCASHGGWAIRADVLAAAAAAGQLRICQWLRQRCCPWGKSLEGAALSGRRTVCEWLIAEGCPWNAEAVRSAARGGHLELMSWLLCGNDVPGVCLLAAAAEGFDLSTLQRLTLPGIGNIGDFGHNLDILLLNNIDEPLLMGEALRIIPAAAGSPTPDWRAKVEWLEARGYPRHATGACVAAASQADDADAVARLAWLRQHGHVADTEAATAAARAGNAGALQYLLTEAGVRPSDRTARAAAEGGHLAVLHALHAGGWPINAEATLGSAARFARLPVVAWLVETFAVQVPELSPEVFLRAAKSGSVEMLAWLRERGCPWSPGAFSAAVQAGCEEAVRWLVEQGCPTQGRHRPLRVPLANGDLATWECLQRLGFL